MRRKGLFGIRRQKSASKDEKRLKNLNGSVRTKSLKRRKPSKQRKKIEVEVEDHYESRKLLIRQMQGIIAKEQCENSEYDSWSDLEENFARAYEPIPLEIRLETWRKMSKENILRNVRSKRMREEFKGLNHAEIIQKIELMQKSAKYLSEKFGVDQLFEGGQVVEAEVHHREDSISNFSQNVPEYVSRTEILNHYYNNDGSRPKLNDGSRTKLNNENDGPKLIENGGPKIESGGPKTMRHDSWSSRASSILKNPESIYVSRVEVLKNLKTSSHDAKISTPQPPLIGGRKKRNEGQSKELRMLNGSPKLNLFQFAMKTFQPSRKQQKIKEEEHFQSETSSLCSCTSCEMYYYSSCSCSECESSSSSLTSSSSATTIKEAVEIKPEEEKIEEEEIPTRSKVKQIQQLLEGKEENQQLYELIDAKEIKRQRNAKILKKHISDIASGWDSKINDLNTLRRSQVLSELKKFLRLKIIEDDDLKPEEINKEVEVLLRQALDSNFETISDVNVGQMYIPMEEQKEKKVQLKHTDYDTFGSIDSLIFEPRNERRTDIKEAQKTIDEQFQYLNLEDGCESVEELQPERGTVGLTTFAERVKLFQNLSEAEKRLPTAVKPPKKITFTDIKATTWKQLASVKGECCNLQDCGCSSSKDKSLNNLSSTTASWNYEHKQDSSSEDSSLSQDSVIPNNFVTPSATANKKPNDLRLQLKEAFGAEMSQNNFLSEYATRTCLFAETPSDRTDAILVRQGETVKLTEEMFRGELKGTLKKLCKKEEGSGKKKANSGSEMGDSGIASPPVAPSLLKVDEEEEKEVKPTVAMKKRDTMIRELKSKLKEKFNYESSTPSSSSSEPSMVVLAPGTVTSRRESMAPKLAMLLGGKMAQKPPAPVALPIPPPAATVTSFKNIYLGEKKPSDEYSESSVYDPSLPDALQKNIQHSGLLFRGDRPFTPPVNSKGDSEPVKKPKSPVLPKDEVVSSLVREEEKLAEKLANAKPEERRDLLYGPGGIFGPKGPFSTPAVRYPNGLEVPAKKNVRFEAEKESPPVVLDPTSRMETYRQEWASQECHINCPSRPLLPQDVERWREEKAKRMLAWLNSSELEGYWGNETPWWKVRELFQMTDAPERNKEETSYFDSLNLAIREKN